MTTPNIIEFVTDPQLLGLSISLAQEVLLRGIYGLALLNADQRAIWDRCTGGRPYREGHSYPETAVVAGARSGKDSRIAAPVLLNEAAFGGHDRHLGRGERATIPIVSQDSRANATMRGYVFSYAVESPILRGLVEDERRDELMLRPRTSVICFPNVAPAFRSWSIPAAGMSETELWRLAGSADSGPEIQAAIRRGMIGFDQTRLLKISTPYMRGGLIQTDYERAYGVDDPDLLVWQAPSVLMNPTLGSRRLEQERRLDPLRFQREYEALWIDDVAAAFESAWIAAAVDRYRPAELAPRPGVRYLVVTDPSGAGTGDNSDEWTLCVAHVEDSRLVIDVLRARGRSGGVAPNLEGIVAEFSGLAKTYSCQTIVGDRYAAGWVRQAFARQGIAYLEAPCDRSAAYLELLPWLVQGRVTLPNDDVLVRQLRNLERRARPGGRDVIDHPRSQHDDRSNVVALAAALATRAEGGRCHISGCDDPDCGGPDSPPWLVFGSDHSRAWHALHFPGDRPDDDVPAPILADDVEAFDVAALRAARAPQPPSPSRHERERAHHEETAVERAARSATGFFPGDWR